MDRKRAKEALLRATTEEIGRGGFVLREPKGVPDVILIGQTDEAGLLFDAADVLAVQGITARLVAVTDPDRFDAIRNDLIPQGIPCTAASDGTRSYETDADPVLKQKARDAFNRAVGAFSDPIG
jgi:transketolase